MCWVAADRGARLARIREDHATADRWQEAAKEIHADICENGVDERGVFVQHYGTDALDASLLLMPLVRFLPPDDPRVRATVLAIADELTENDLVLRYRVDATDDGFASEEGTFTICSFWLVSALVEVGELARARGLCEKLLHFTAGLALYAEEIDAATGRRPATSPRRSTRHLAQINAVVHILRRRGAAPAPRDGWRLSTNERGAALTPLCRSVEIFLYVFVVSHLVGDYLIQTDWQAMHKRGGLRGRAECAGRCSPMSPRTR